MKFAYKNKSLQYAVIILGALLSTYSVARLATLDSISYIAPGRSFVLFIVFAALMFLNLRVLFKQQFMLTASILSVFFSIFTLLGMSFDTLGNWDFIFGSVGDFFKSLLFGIGFYMIYYCATKVVLNFIDKKPKPINSDSKVTSFIESHQFFVAFICILVCWLPYIIICYPGSLPHDAYYQINQFFGISSKTSHHPYFGTMIFGIIMKIGRVINDNFGIFLIVLFQSVVGSAVYALVCTRVRKLTTSIYPYVFTLVFYAVVPIWGAFSQAVIKDTLFVAIFTLFMTETICLLTRKEELSKRNLVFYALICLLVCLLRNGLIIVVFPTVICLFFVLKGKKAKTFYSASIAVFLAGLFLFNSVILPAMGVAEGSKREMLSVPFQQTARYIQEHEDELTKKEIKVIDSVLDYEVIKEKYNPDISDPVKGTFREDASRKDLVKYFKLWIKQFLKHPDTYIQATIHNSYGYYYPYINRIPARLIQFYIYIKGEPVATGDFDIHYVNDEAARDSVQNYCDWWYSAPGTSIFTNVGLYTWALMLLVAALLRKKSAVACIALISPILQVLLCIASPVNGLLRYAMPLMACMPLLIAFTVYSIRQKNETAELNEETESPLKDK